MNQATLLNDFNYDGSSIKVYQCNKGEGLPKHEHHYSHAVICVSGSCLIKKDNVERILTIGTQPLNLKANEWHEIEALEDNTVFINVFAENKY
jgi:quercetin dioxygenase-like cupin family protein